MSINWWMGRWNVVYSHNGTLAIKKNEVLVYSTAWMNLKNIMLSEISHPQKTTQCMIPRTGTVLYTHFDILLHSPKCCFNAAGFQTNKSSGLALGNPIVSIPMCCAGLSRSVVSNSCDPTDCSLPGSSVHGILQVRMLEWVAISFSIKWCNNYHNFEVVMSVNISRCLQQLL